MLRSGLLSIAAGALLIAACGSFGSSDTTPPGDDGGRGVEASAEAAACTDTTSDSSNCGTCGRVCGAGTTCVASTCVPGCRDKVLYVSGDGKDDNDGCSTAMPLRTIGAAVARVATQSLVGHEIHVCRGTYAERALVVDHAVTMRGGYNCLTWTRATGFGAAGGFADPNETIVTNADYAVSISTFDITGAAVDATVRIEGFTFVGAAVGKASSNALVIRDGAAPLITDVQAKGGGTSTASPTGIGSAGILIHDGAHPEVMNSVAEGGSGTSSFRGSVGVAVSAASASIHNSTIRGGSGIGGVGCIGLLVDESPVAIPMVIHDDTIEWEGCRRDSADAGQVAFGIAVPSGSVTIQANRILGGKATCPGGVCGAIGIDIASSAHASIRGNALYAGDVTGLAGLATEGIVIEGANAVDVTGNVIHAGGRTSGSINVSLGIDVHNGVDASITGNTIIFASGNTVQSRLGIRLIGNVGTTDGPKNTSIRGNLFVGSLAGSTIEYGIERWACTAATATNVHQNVFVGVSSPGREVSNNGGVCNVTSQYPLPSAMDAAFGVTGADDSAVSPNCNDPANCFPGVVCTDAVTCAAAVFQAWHAPSFGGVNVTSAAGVRLAPTLPCAIAKASYALPAGVTSDLYGTARTSPFSIGAAEQETCVP